MDCRNWPNHIVLRHTDQRLSNKPLGDENADETITKDLDIRWQCLVRD
jgi:hypothetical protein